MCNCECCKCGKALLVTNAAIADGITTLTIDSTENLQNKNKYCLLLIGVTIPAGTSGTQINVTDGTNTMTVYNRLANYWRPCRALQQGDRIKAVYLNDPSHLLKG